MRYVFSSFHKISSASVSSEVRDTEDASCRSYHRYGANAFERGYRSTSHIVAGGSFIRRDRRASHDDNRRGQNNGLRRGAAQRPGVRGDLLDLEKDATNRAKRGWPRCGGGGRGTESEFGGVGRVNQPGQTSLRL